MASIVALPAASGVGGSASRPGCESSGPWILTHHRLGLGPSPASRVAHIPFPSLLADQLDPGESLILRYDLRPAAASDATATVILRTRGDQGTFVDRRNAQRIALSMCLPGYKLEGSDGEMPLPEGLLAPGHDTLAMVRNPESDLPTELSPSARLGTASIRLPLLPPWAIRVDRLLVALRDGGHVGTLSIELTRLGLGPREARLIDRAREALRAREMSLAADGGDAALVRFQIALLRGWSIARSGIGLSCRLGFEGRAAPSLLTVASGLLFGPRPRQRLAAVDDGEADLDLSLALAPPMPTPVLLPAAGYLDRFGFFSRRRWRDHPASPDRSCQIGATPDGTRVSISSADLGRHLYIIGATGVGKSTLMSRMIRQDIENGVPTVLVDPHGDLFQDTLDGLTEEQRCRTCVADLSGPAGGFGLDLLNLSGDRPDVRLNFVCNQLISVFRKVLYRDQPEGFGPMFEAYFRNALMLLVRGAGPRCSLSDFDRVFGDKTFRSDLLASCTDEIVARFWKQTAARAGGEAALENIAPYIICKLTQFTGNPLIRPIIDGTQPNVNFDRVFDKRGILLINLAKGFVGETDAALVGAMFSITLFSKALARSALPPHRRGRVRLYLDEFQTYASDVLSQMLAECRKFGLELVLANQSLSQISGARSKPDVAEAILANVGTVMAFRTGPRDARMLEDWFAPTFDARALMQLRDHSFVLRMLQNGSPLEPLMVHTAAKVSSSLDSFCQSPTIIDRFEYS